MNQEKAETVSSQVSLYFKTKKTFPSGVNLTPHE